MALVVDASNNVYWAGSAEANNSSRTRRLQRRLQAPASPPRLHPGGGLVNPIGEAIPTTPPATSGSLNSDNAFANPGTVSKFSSAGVSLRRIHRILRRRHERLRRASPSIPPATPASHQHRHQHFSPKLSPTGTPSAGSPYTGGGTPLSLRHRASHGARQPLGRSTSMTPTSAASPPPAPPSPPNAASTRRALASAGQSGHVTVARLQETSGSPTGPATSPGQQHQRAASPRWSASAAPTVTPIALALKNHTHRHTPLTQQRWLRNRQPTSSNIADRHPKPKAASPASPALRPDPDHLP